VTVAAGGSVTVPFTIPTAKLKLTTADGSRKQYAGSHELVFSRGNGQDVKVAVTI
jgi:hypothetical protein